MNYPFARSVPLSRRLLPMFIVVVVGVAVGPLRGQQVDPLESVVVPQGESANPVTVVDPAIGLTTSDCCPPQVAITQRTRCRIQPVRICPADDVWLISARESHCHPSDMSRLECSRLRNGGWECADLNHLISLHATDKSKATMLYVHGNRTGLKWAKSRGLQFYNNAFKSQSRPPMRYVIFAWRSEMERIRFLKDYGIKSQRSVCIGETLGHLLMQFGDRELVLGGFSLGAQVVLSALAKPELQGTPDDGLGKYRVAIYAPALDASYICASMATYPQNRIVHQTDIFLNRGDRAVKVSERIARRKTQTDFSLRDFSNTVGEYGNVISIHDISREVRNRHSIVNYGRSPKLNVAMAGLLNATTGCCGGSSLPPILQAPDELPLIDTPVTDSVPTQ